MSLATRCPSCGTVFRVVQDQLRVSEGWVRCGRCNGVFNAAEVLFDIDSGATVSADLGLPLPATTPARPPPPPAASNPPAPAWPASPPTSPPGSADATAWASGRQEPRFDADTPAEARWPREEAIDEPLLRAPSRHHDDDLGEEIFITDHVPTAAPPALPGARPGAITGSMTGSLTSPLAAPGSPVFAAPAAALADETPVRVDFSAAAAAASAAALPSPAQALPSFLRSAERHALWRRPAMRTAAAIGVLLLALVLVLQAAVLWRDTLAARWPAGAPALTALCRLAGCSVQPLRRIESLAVHSSALNRLEGSTLYRLRVVLQNRADTAVMMPALELTLNDAQGKLVARRVLQPAELGAPQTRLQAGEELPITALVSTGERRVDGYTLELFYP